jgi:long-chain acyl-CoA synthetase
MFPEGTRSPDGAIHEFKSGAGYLALHAGCDVLPIHLSGTFDVLGKGKLLPRHAPVEVRIGRVLTIDELRLAAQDAEGAGAYRTLADRMRQAVLGLTANGAQAARIAAIEAVSPPALESDAHHESPHHERRRSHRSGGRAKG